MRHTFFINLTSFVSLFLAMDAFGQNPPPAKMPTTTQPSSTIKRTPHLDSTTPQTSSSFSSKKEFLTGPMTPSPLAQEQAEYLHPGILVNIGGKWEGSDHLLNISNQIGVYVSIIKPETEQLDVADLQIKKEVENIFTQATIKPQNLVTEGKPPLPAFQIEIFVYPIERGYVACCSGRLFESVVLDRFKMDPNMAFQAITWEKQHLIVSPKEQFAEQLTKTVQDIANTFGERFQTYQRIRKSL